MKNLDPKFEAKPNKIDTLRRQINHYQDKLLEREYIATQVGLCQDLKDEIDDYKQTISFLVFTLQQLIGYPGEGYYENQYEPKESNLHIEG